MRGYVVVDIETTGLSYKRGHRIVELGVVEVSQNGEIERSWETLVNPQRHVSATDIHGITAADVFGAPTFEQISDKLVASLEGRVLVAHNASFDSRFLHDELHHCGRCGEISFPAIDTVKLARTYLGLPKSRLSDCCEHLGLNNELAHSALSDALVTAQLFQHFLHNTPALRDDYILEKHAESAAFVGLQVRNGWNEPMLHSREVAAKAREAAQEGGWFAGLVNARREPSSDVVEKYFKLLDASFLDRHLSATEQSQLLAFAQDHGLGADSLQELHETYITLLLEKAWEDGVISEEERSIVHAVARALGIPHDDVETALATNLSGSGEDQSHSRPENTKESTGVVDAQEASGIGNLGGIILSPGDRVTVTGAKKYSNSEWKEYLSAHSVELGGLVKKTKVLIAADPDSQSGKAKKAKSYGIPVIAEDIAREVIKFAD